ncbi:MAG TPA: A/G-specific adenine glycosylase [Terriglobales bacterium]|nr:A/G-specific adenine glycosylase [Terriglobales bacterium]
MPTDPINPAVFRRRLLRWYDAHARALPWRRTRNPYRIWVSEIMLQQTRVAAVLAHYREFLRRFPTVEALAAAREDEVLAAWSGLGYYRRARMLHRAAREVVQRHSGKLPRDVEGLRQLPGIGRYTAAAIASIAFEAPAAVVDGNVERVIARLEGAAPKNGALWTRADALLDPRRPGDFNQAMMELGATVCVPEAPHCGRCPVKDDCATRGALPSGPREIRKKQALAYALARRDGAVRLVQRRKDESLMAGMWELPAHQPNGAAPAMRLRHSITTTDYAVAVYEAAAKKGKWVPLARLPELPLTGLTRKVLRRAGLF